MKSSHVAQLRWDDSQLTPFLRRWRGQNMISSVPRRIARPDGQVSQYKGIEAGLLKYAWNLINNEVVNDFKRMTRTMDMTCMVFNNGLSPDADESDSVVWELDDNGEKMQMVVKDSSSMDEFRASENGFDIMSMARRANLSDDEMNIIMQVDLMEEDMFQYAESVGKPVARVHRMRTLALEKMRHVDVSDTVLTDMAESMCQKHKCSAEDMFGDSRVGPCVLARTEFFYELSKLGLSTEEMSTRTGVSVDRVLSSVGRGELRHKNNCSPLLTQ
jgi:DNA-directed RNA polymerase specialized sigma24 family protein